MDDNIIPNCTSCLEQLQNVSNWSNGDLGWVAQVNSTTSLNQHENMNVTYNMESMRKVESYYEWGGSLYSEIETNNDEWSTDYETGYANNLNCPTANQITCYIDPNMTKSTTQYQMNHHSNSDLYEPLSTNSVTMNMDKEVDHNDFIIPPEQNMTFSSPESAFYDYQKKMENQLCQVCKESAAGFHHGAYVCEACKKFFIRHYLNRTRFSVPCPTGGHCAMLRPGRIKCQSCRFQKCIAVGMNLQGTNGVNPKFDISKIPCRVCDGKSSGFHFGALTCEGCKGFFRRTVQINQQLICVKGTDNCKLSGTSSRSMCKSCRFRKCLEVGMSKNGSRIGRQPNAVKFHCVLEIIGRNDSANQIALKEEISPDLKYQSKYDKVNLVNDYNDNSSDTNRYLISSPNILHPILNIDFNNGSIFESMEEKSIFQECICNAMSQMDRAKLNLKQYSDQNWLLRSNPTMEELWDYMMNYFNMHSAMTVQFAKSIPGFNELELPIRREMVRESLYPIMLLRLACDYDHENDEYNYFDFPPRDRSMIFTYFPNFVRVAQHLLKISQQMYGLQLSKYQLGLLIVIELTRNSEFDTENEAETIILKKAKLLLYESLSDLALENEQIARINLVFEQLPRELKEMDIEHTKIIQRFMEDRPELNYHELYVDMFRIFDTPKSTEESIDDDQSIVMHRY